MSKPIFDPLSQTPPADRPWGINFGGGLNSHALVIECYNRGHWPDWILFCDTGSEKPQTYEAIDRFAAWLDEHRFTPLSRTRWEREEPIPDGRTFEPIEDYCLRTGYLPSIAYGNKGCSYKYKRQPGEKWRKERGFEATVYALGFDAGEHKRVSRPKCARVEGPLEEPWYPLYAWKIGRAACERIVADAGLPPVPKSACFFCPNMKPHEWRALAKDNPELFARALALEQNAIDAGNADGFGLLRSKVPFLKYLPMNPEHDERWVTGDLFKDGACDCFESEAEAA